MRDAAPLVLWLVEQVKTLLRRSVGEQHEDTTRLEHARDLAMGRWAGWGGVARSAKG